MDNLTVSVVYRDDDLMELRVLAENSYARVWQNQYTHWIDGQVLGERIVDFTYSSDESCYIEFGSKHGNYTPCLSLNFIKAGGTGWVKIEADMEIADDPARGHRCQLYVSSELGRVEQLGLFLQSLFHQNVGDSFSLLFTD